MCSVVESLSCASQQLDAPWAVSLVQEGAFVASTQQPEQPSDSSCVLWSEPTWTVIVTSGIESHEKPQAIERREIILHAATVELVKQVLLLCFGYTGDRSTAVIAARSWSLYALNFGVGPLER